MFATIWWKTVHAIWGCQLVKDIWWEDKTCRPHSRYQFASFKDLLMAILNFSEPNLADLFAMLGRSIWYKVIMLSDCNKFHYHTQKLF